MARKISAIHTTYDIHRVTRLDVDSFIEKHEIFYHEGGFYIFLEKDKIFVEDMYIQFDNT